MGQIKIGKKTTLMSNEIIQLGRLMQEDVILAKKT